MFRNKFERIEVAFKKYTTREDIAIAIVLMVAHFVTSTLE